MLSGRMTRSDSASEGQSLLVTISDKKLQQKSGNLESGYGAAEGKDSNEEHMLFLQDGRRLHCLDIARIVCVGLVAVNHGGSTWSDQFGLWNEMYVQQWVLQWLFMICGMSFAMSSRNTYGYLSRLAIYFIIGVFTNWCAFVIKGMNWKDNFWNVVFQFWFIFGLMIYVIALTPLKHYLNTVRSGSPPVHTEDFGFIKGILIIFLMLTVVHFTFKLLLAPAINVSLGKALVEFAKDAGPAAEFWGMPHSSHESLLFIQELLSYIQISIGSLIILWLMPKLTGRLQITNWLVLFNVFIFRCFWYRGQFARIVDGFDFTLIGLANFYLGLKYRRTIGKYMVRYWFFVLFVFSLLIPPGTWGRFDETTIHQLSFRIRYHIVEFAMTVLLLCAAERIADDSIFTEDSLDWLNWWALYLFLFHKAIHILIPHPLNWLVILLMAPAAWFIHGKKSYEAVEHTTTKDVEKAVESQPQRKGREKGSGKGSEKQDKPPENLDDVPADVSQLEGR